MLRKSSKELPDLAPATAYPERSQSLTPDSTGLIRPQIGAVLAARILAFRTVAPLASRQAANLGRAPHRSVRRHTTPSKVLTMSTYARSLHAKDSAEGHTSMLATVRAELADHYVEVEPEGLSLARLGCIYIAGFREATNRLTDGLRALLRLRAAH